jgi:hypothetical protein
MTGHMRCVVASVLLALALGSAQVEARPGLLRGWFQRLLPDRDVPHALRRDGVGYVLRDPAWKKGATFASVRPLLEQLPAGWRVAVQNPSGSFYFQSIGWLLKNPSLDPNAVLKDGRVYCPQDLAIKRVSGQLARGRRQLIAAEEYFDGQHTVHRYYEPKDLSRLRDKSILSLQVVDLPSMAPVGRKLARVRPDELVRVEGTEVKPNRDGEPRPATATSINGVYRRSEAQQLISEKALLDLPRLSRIEGRQDPRPARWTFYRKDRRPLWGRGDQASPRATSVRQGRLGNCWFVSRVAAIARANPEYAKSMIRARGKGRYEVRLYVRTADGGVEQRWVPVTGRLPRRFGLWTHYANSTDGKWVGLIEKAAAKVAGGYAALAGDAGGTDLNGFELLLGRRGQHLASKDLDDRALLETINDALRGGKPVVTGSRAGDDDAIKKHRIVPYHAYAISGVDLERGTVDLQNPWGHRHVRALPIAEFKDLYPSLQIGRIPTN